MDLSIIIVNWNAKEFLLPCLESLEREIEGLAVEIFVVDNGSTDGSGSAIRERFPAVTVFENGRNLGFARANNQALRRSVGKYALLLNPDTRIKEGAIRCLLSFMEDQPKAAVAGAQLLNRDGSKQNSIANFPSLATELLNKSLLRRVFPERFPGKERALREPIEVDSVIGACMVVRRKAIEEVGLLDEEYFLFMEETDWCYRMAQAGWKVYHVPRAEVFHFQGKSAELEKRRAKVEFYKSLYRFFKKNRGEIQWFLLLTGTILRLAVEVISMSALCALTCFRFRSWRQRLSILSYVLWWHLRLCPEAMGLGPSGSQNPKQK